MVVAKLICVCYTNAIINKGCIGMKKRLLSALLGAAMLVSTIPAALAYDLDGHWAKEYIEYLDQEGVINPSASTGNYEPNRDMTRAEFMRYINRAFHFTEKASISFDDVNSDAWYYETIQIAVKYGYINGVAEDEMDPLGDITREQAAVIIGRLFKDDPGNVSAGSLPFDDRDQIASWSAGYIKAAVDKGILSGYEDGTFRPKQVVTRGEVAKILYFYLGTSLSREDGSYTGADLKSDTENVTISESCTLSDAVVEGDLYLTEGLGSDAVTLNNVTVEGTMIVSGGTVILNNTECDNIIISSPMGRLMQVTATGAARIGTTEVGSAAALHETDLTGDGFAAVEVQADSRVSLTLDAQVDSLSLLSEATVSTSEGSAVYALTAQDGASVTGYGTVYQADIRANGVSFASSVTVGGYTLADGVTATIGGKQVQTSSEADVVPDVIQFDKSELEDELSGGVDIYIPAGRKVSRVECDGDRLYAGSDYVTTDRGIQLQAEWLETLSRGSYTLTIEFSGGGSADIAVEVEDSAPETQMHTAYFDRYSGASDYKDVSVRLNNVSSEADIASVIFGWEALEPGVDYTFQTGSRSLTLRRDWLKQLRAGSYTITVEVKRHEDERIQLTVEDSSPYEQKSSYSWKNDWDNGDVGIDLPAERVSDIAGVTLYYDGDDQHILLTAADYEEYEEGASYKYCWLDGSENRLWIMAETIEHYEAYLGSDGYLTVAVELDGGDTCTMTLYA